MTRVTKEIAWKVTYGGVGAFWLAAMLPRGTARVAAAAAGAFGVTVPWVMYWRRGPVRFLDGKDCKRQVSKFSTEQLQQLLRQPEHLTETWIVDNCTKEQVKEIYEQLKSDPYQLWQGTKSKKAFLWKRVERWLLADRNRFMTESTAIGTAQFQKAAGEISLALGLSLWDTLEMHENWLEGAMRTRFVPGKSGVTVGELEVLEKMGLVTRKALIAMAGYPRMLGDGGSPEQVGWAIDQLSARNDLTVDEWIGVMTKFLTSAATKGRGAIAGRAMNSYLKEEKPDLDHDWVKTLIALPTQMKEATAYREALLDDLSQKKRGSVQLILAKWRDAAPIMVRLRDPEYVLIPGEGEKVANAEPTDPDILIRLAKMRGCIGEPTHGAQWVIKQLFARKDIPLQELISIIADLGDDNLSCSVAAKATAKYLQNHELTDDLKELILPPIERYHLRYIEILLEKAPKEQVETLTAWCDIKLKAVWEKDFAPGKTSLRKVDCEKLEEFGLMDVEKLLKMICFRNKGGHPAQVEWAIEKLFERENVSTEQQIKAMQNLLLAPSAVGFAELAAKVIKPLLEGGDLQQDEQRLLLMTLPMQLIDGIFYVQELTKGWEKEQQDALLAQYFTYVVAERLMRLMRIVNSKQFGKLSGDDLTLLKKNNLPYFEALPLMVTTGQTGSLEEQRVGRWACRELLKIGEKTETEITRLLAVYREGQDSFNELQRQYGRKKALELLRKAK